jgi:hypothetical protein
VAADVIKHRLDDMRLYANIGHARGDRSAEIMHGPILHTARHIEREFFRDQAAKPLGLFPNTRSSHTKKKSRIEGLRRVRQWLSLHVLVCGCL